MSNVVPTNNANAIVPGGIDLSAAMAAAAQLGKDGVEVLERLYAIAKEEKATAAKASFARAMAAFRGDMPMIRKSVAGQHGVTHAGTRTKGLYAPLDTITPILDPVASRHGFTYRFNREVYEGKDYISCIVTHVDGHEIASRFPAPPDTGRGRSDIQAVASGESYARRYSLTAVFALTCADPDTDGADPTPSGSAPIGAPGAITEQQYMNLKALATEVGADPEKFLAFFNINALADLPEARLPEAIRMLEAKRKHGAK